MGKALAKEQALAERLADLSLDQTGCLAPARGRALARLNAMGLPTKRDEYWRYTDPATLTSTLPVPAALFDSGDEPAAFEGIDRLKIVFTDGVFDVEASDTLTMHGLKIELLQDIARTDIHWVRDFYGMLEAHGQSPVERPLAALNTAFAASGVMIHVTGKAAKPVHLIYNHKSEVSDAILHHCIKIEPGAEMTLLESGPAAARFNNVTEVDLADSARFHHIRTQGRDHARRACTHIFARLAAHAHFKSFTVTANGRMTRNDAVVDLAGPDASAHIAGASMGDGDFHHDDTIFITHRAERCESRQVFKKVLKNGAVGVFQGKILVKNTAQKTDGYQISQALLLDDDSQFLAKPELEIYADDVKCSHGSTSGSIDETALYYLRSRGVPLKEAQSLMVQAFLAEAIDEIDDETIAEDVRSRLRNWLARHTK